MSHYAPPKTILESGVRKNGAWEGEMSCYAPPRPISVPEREKSGACSPPPHKFVECYGEVKKKQGTRKVLSDVIL